MRIGHLLDLAMGVEWWTPKYDWSELKTEWTKWMGNHKYEQLYLVICCKTYQNGAVVRKEKKRGGVQNRKVFVCS